MNVGFINLSEEFEESYLEAFKVNYMVVTILDIEDCEKKLSKFDGVVIFENGPQDTARTCSILLKLKEYKKVDIWVVSSSVSEEFRTLYLKLGVVGVVAEEYSVEDVALLVFNSLSKVTEYTLCESEYFKDMMLENDKNAYKIRLIPRNNSVIVNGKKEVHLTLLEYKAIEFLYENKNSTVTYEDLFKALWAEDFSGQKYRVTNLVFHLRGKVESQSSGNGQLIYTVRSKGYMLRLRNNLTS